VSSARTVDSLPVLKHDISKLIGLVPLRRNTVRLSTRGRYATKAMLDLAFHYGEGPIMIREIAQRQGVSGRYLEHLVSLLRTAGLVKSTRGARGGFTLAKPPSEIKVSDIIRICEGSIAPTECVDNPEICSRNEFCVARDIWVEMKEAMDGILESTTLQDLIERQQEKGRQKTAMYHI